MESFRILAHVPTSGLKYVDRSIDTTLTSAGSNAHITTEKGLMNPAGLMIPELFSGSLISRTKQQDISGGPSGGLTDAVRALHELGDKHGVMGISLSSTPTQYGGIMFSDDRIGYVSGNPVIDRIGREAAFDIDHAARNVVDLLKR